MTPENLKRYLYPTLAGVVALALVMDGLFLSKTGERILTGLAILVPGVGKK